MFSYKKGVCLNLGRLVTLMRHRECLMLTEHHVNWCMMDWRGSVNSFFMYTIEFFLTKIVLKLPMTNLTHTRSVLVRDASDSTHFTHPESIKPAPEDIWYQTQNIVFGIRSALSLGKMWKMWPSVHEPLGKEWLLGIWQFHCLTSRRQRLLTSGVVAVWPAGFNH